MKDRAPILVVDDDAEMRAYLEIALTGQGHVVVSASSPSECGPDLVPCLALVDLVTRGEPAIPLIRRLAAAGVPVVVMTGLSGESPVVTACMEAGGGWRLSKPFSLSALRALVAELTGP